MAEFNVYPPLYVVAKDKATERVTVLTITGPHDPTTAKAHVESMPGSFGGAHPGFEVLSVEKDQEVAAKMAEDANPKPPVAHKLETPTVEITTSAEAGKA